jgi:hypothetical protein
MQYLIRQLSNAHVMWEGNAAELMPHLPGGPADELTAKGAQAVPALIGVLNDPDRSVAAHVLLTRLSGIH